MDTIQLSDKCCREGITINELLIELLCLPANERARIAEELLCSLEDADEDVDGARVEEAWAAEIERRSTEIAEGRVQPVPWEVTRAELLKKLERVRGTGSPS